MSMARQRTYRLQRARPDGQLVRPRHEHRPASGFIEYHETSPPPGGAFYRAVQP